MSYSKLLSTVFKIALGFLYSFKHIVWPPWCLSSTF